jgi:hypothetical protein
MDTFIHTSNVTIAKSIVTIKKNKLSEFWADSESNRFGIIPILVVVIACIGGITAAYGTYSDTFRLALVVFPTIISLALVLAVAPMRWILSISTLAILIDLLLFIF